jgi:CheY-like chemotaxis protein
MFDVLIVDDEHEDREILQLEIEQALAEEEQNIRFFEASNIRKAQQLLNLRHFNLLTLDIQFDRLNEGLEALPEFFENYPTLNIIVVSGKLNKAEVTDRLFQFTKNNVLKGKRWARHFDVLDKKDDKKEAIQWAYHFSIKQEQGGDRIRELFLLAESYLEKDLVDKCLEIYQELQKLVPGDLESRENIQIFQGVFSVGQASEYLKYGEPIIAALILGHLIEKKLKNFSKSVLGYSYTTLAENSKELEKSKRISKFTVVAFQKLHQMRNRAVHQPMTLSESDFKTASRLFDDLEISI